MTNKKLIQLNTRVPAKLKKDFDRTLKERGQNREHVMEQLLAAYVGNISWHETETG